MKTYSILLATTVLTGGMVVQAQTAQPAAAVAKTQISIADARRRIDKAIDNPSVMTALMRHLSAEDQKQFVADVNKAISDMPGSTEEKTAKFLNVNKAAIRGAAKGNSATLLAEIYATVSPEALTVINERFAEDLLNRSAGANASYSDEDFTKISLAVMNKVSERCEAADNSASRSTFAILMLVRASGGSPADLTDKLVETLKSDEAKEMARNEWIPSALGGEGREKNYEPILASSDSGRRPDPDLVLRIAGPQFGDVVLADIFGSGNNASTPAAQRTPNLNAVVPIGAHDRPMFDADLDDRTVIVPKAGGDIEPRPYPWQWMH